MMLGVAHNGDVDDGKPHRDLMSHPSAEQPSPADSPSLSESFDPVRPLPFIAKGREMIAWWTSSALLCALMFLLCSLYAFDGKVSTPLPSNTLHLAPPAPSTLSSASHGRRTRDLRIQRGAKC